MFDGGIGGGTVNILGPNTCCKNVECSTLVAAAEIFKLLAGICNKTGTRIVCSVETLGW